MSLVRMNFFAESLNMRVEVMAVLPEYPRQRERGENYKEKFPANRKFPVLYFMNGFTGDYTDGLTMMPVERFAQDTGIAVVMPSGLNSWYEDIKGNVHMKTFMSAELPAAMEALLPVSEKAEDRFLGGISMGARGAAMISAQYYDRYRAAICLSAPLYLPELLGQFRKHMQCTSWRERFLWAIAWLGGRSLSRFLWPDFFLLRRLSEKTAGL